MEDACTPATTAENIKKGLGIYYDPTCSDTGCGVGELCHAACDPFFLRDMLPRDSAVPWYFSLRMQHGVEVLCEQLVWRARNMQTGTQTRQTRSTSRYLEKKLAAKQERIGLALNQNEPKGNEAKPNRIEPNPFFVAAAS